MMWMVGNHQQGPPRDLVSSHCTPRGEDPIQLDVVGPLRAAVPAVQRYKLRLQGTLLDDLVWATNSRFFNIERGPFPQWRDPLPEDEVARLPEELERIESALQLVVKRRKGKVVVCRDTFQLAKAEVLKLLREEKEPLERIKRALEATTVELTKVIKQALRLWTEFFDFCELGAVSRVAAAAGGTTSATCGGPVSQVVGAGARSGSVDNGG
eukprot:Polyplicarium_translucidae@DN3396_c2_g1_i16.p1